MNGRYFASYKVPSHWMSCRLITKDLEEAYPDFGPWFQDDGSAVPSDLSYLAIIDHRWLSASALSRLKAVQNAQAELYVFGDLTLKLKVFHEHLLALKHLDLRIITASEAQRRLVISLFPETKGITSVVPYPVDLGLFQRTEDGRSKWRQFLKVSADEKLFGYAGRVSDQKGVLELLQAYCKIETELPSRLVIAGPYHPHPFWQFSNKIDDSFEPMLKKLIVLAGPKVQWLPTVPREEMPGLYSAMDLFVSPSTFHDEDFGLTASEARACGTPCLLTAWGGYLRFLGDKDVSFTGLEEGKLGYKAHVPSLAKAMTGELAPLLPSLPAPSELTPEDLQYLLAHDKFLNSGGTFDWPLYRKVYASYRQIVP